MDDKGGDAKTTLLHAKALISRINLRSSAAGSLESRIIVKSWSSSSTNILLSRLFSC